MVDTVTLNPGTGGDTIAADDAGAAGKVQIVKLALSADGSASPITADAGGLLVNLGTNNDVTVTGSVTAAGDVGTLDQIDLANTNPLAVAIVDGSGDQITSFGGGTQYTQGDTDASITGTAMLMEGAADTLLPVQGTVADGLLVNLGGNNDVTVTSGSITATQGTGTNLHMVVDSGTVTTVSTVTSLTQMNGAAISMGTGVRDAGTQRVTIATNDAVPVTFTGSTDVATQTTLASLLTSSQLIDDTVFTDDTSTHTTAVTKGLGVMAVANPTDAAVDANDIGMVAMTLARALKGDITTIAGTAPTTAGFIDIKGADGNVFVRQATASNLNMTEASAANSLTALQLIDDMIYTDDTSTHATGTSKGAGIMAAATPTDTAVNANDIGMLGMTNNRELYVSIRDIVGAAAQSGSGTATGALRVELANNGTGTLATVSTVTAVTSITNTVTTQGGAAHAAPAAGNPNLVAGRASAAIPTDVGADGDAASLWTNRNGAVVVLQAPHLGLNGDPWSLVHEGVQYTTAQTSAVVVAGGASEKIVVTQVQIQAFSTTAGTAILYFGTGAYARGTNRAIFDGEFAPSATLKPGVIMNGPFIAGTNGDDIMFTSVGDVDVTISIWYYVIT